MKTIKRKEVTIYIPETKEDLDKLPEDIEVLESFASLDLNTRKKIKEEAINKKLLRIKK